MRKIIFVVSLPFLLLQALSQQRTIDSLTALARQHTKPDTVRLNLLNDLTFYLSDVNATEGAKTAAAAIDLAVRLNNKQKLAIAYNNKAHNHHALGEDSLALVSYNLALDLNRKISNKKEAAKVLHNIGIVYFDKGDYIKAADYQEQSLHIFEQLQDSGRIAEVLNSLGVIHQYLSDYPGAINYFLKALRLQEQLSEIKQKASTLTNIGITYSYLDKFKQSLEYHQKAMDAYNSIGNRQGMAYCYNNMGNVYDNMDDTAMALQSYKKALAINESTGNKRAKASNLANIGIVYNFNNQYNDAYEYLSKALHEYESSGDKYNTSLLLNEIAKLYVNAPDAFIKQKGIVPADRYLKAIELNKRSLSLAEETGSLTREGTTLESMSDIYARQHNFKASLDAYKRSVALRDSTLSQEKRDEVTQKEMQFAFEKKEAIARATYQKEQELATAEINRQRIIKNSAMGVTAILLLAAVSSFVFYKRRRDAEILKTAAEFKAQVADTEMKALRAQMNPHFIFNSLNSINDYISKNDIKSAEHYLSKFAKIMRMILEHSEQKEVPLTDDLKALELYMQLECMRMNNKFSYEIKVAADIDKENTLVPPLLLQPFVENSIWHGLSKKEGYGKIIVSITREGNMLNCTVQDNGIGRDAVTKELQTDKKSFGMKITKARIDIINKLKRSNAGINLTDLEEGTKVEVKLPLELSF